MKERLLRLPAALTVALIYIATTYPYIPSETPAAHAQVEEITPQDLPPDTLLRRVKSTLAQLTGDSGQKQPAINPVKADKTSLAQGEWSNAVPLPDPRGPNRIVRFSPSSNTLMQIVAVAPQQEFIIDSVSGMRLPAFFRFSSPGLISVSSSYGGNSSTTFSSSEYPPFVPEPSLSGTLRAGSYSEERTVTLESPYYRSPIPDPRYVTRFWTEPFINGATSSPGSVTPAATSWGVERRTLQSRIEHAPIQRAAANGLPAYITEGSQVNTLIMYTTPTTNLFMPQNSFLPLPSQPTFCLTSEEILTLPPEAFPLPPGLTAC